MTDQQDRRLSARLREFIRDNPFDPYEGFSLDTIDMLERAAKLAELHEDFKAADQLPGCVGYDGGCDGDLVGESHEASCPQPERTRRRRAAFDALLAFDSGSQEDA